MHHDYSWRTMIKHGAPRVNMGVVEYGGGCMVCRFMVFVCMGELCVVMCCMTSIFQFLAFFLTQDRLPKTRPVCVDGFWCILKVVCCQSGGHKSLDSFSISDTHAGDWACQRRGGLAAPVFEQCLLK